MGSDLLHDSFKVVGRMTGQLSETELEPETFRVAPETNLPS